jgi:hypothetical protein
LRIVTQLALYADQNGTELFSNFMDLLLNANTGIVYLYTRDYKHFYDQPYGPLITEGGEWYKVTHVEVTMAFFIDSDVMNNVSLGSATSFYERVKKLFYIFAPITLVIERFYFAYIFKVQFGLAAKVRQTYTKHVIVR